MSHFAVAVLLPVPGDCEQVLDLEHRVGEALEPFNENTEVEGYEEECWCLGREAWSAANEQTTVEFGDLNDTRKKFHAEVRPTLEEGADVDAAWREYVSARVARRDELEQQHEMYQQFNPECEDCQGHGIRTSTYNPQSKWDWWQIGGRWTGHWSPDYEPEKDPRNTETCRMCQGSGMRTDIVELHGKLASGEWVAESERPAFAKDWTADDCHEYLGKTGCNSCQGKGTRSVWPTGWVSHPGDTLPVAALLELDALDASTFAVLTPEGEWVERGKMGWFGMCQDEQEVTDWVAQWKETLEQFPDHIAVVVDCHI